VCVFRQKVTLDNAIGPTPAPIEASKRVPNGIPLGCLLLLPVDTVNCVQTLKGYSIESMVELGVTALKPYVGSLIHWKLFRFDI
jgi:hypothetical protein